MIERIPPQSIDAEMAVIGGCLIDNEAVFEAIEILKPEHFYKEANKKIFQAVVDLANESKSIDLITVSAQLEKQQILESVGGRYYLTELTEQVPSAANIEYHCRIVYDKFVFRQLIIASRDIESDSYNAAENAQDVLDRAEQRLFEISTDTTKKDTVDSAKAIIAAMQEIEDAIQEESGLVGVSYSIPKLDYFTGGMKRQQLIILAAETGVGKTAFALNILKRAGEKGIPGAYFCFEMTNEELILRLVSEHEKINSSLWLRPKDISQKQWSDINRGCSYISKLPLYFNDSPEATIPYLWSQTRKLIMKHGIKFIVVDYLQLMKAVGKFDTREQAVTSLSRGLKNLAKTFDIPVLALSQFKRHTGRPSLNDLRESGAIEQDANVVLFLYADKPENLDIKDIPEIQEVELIIAKNRGGIKNVSFDLIYIGKHYNFRQADFTHVDTVRDYTEPSTFERDPF